MEIKGVKIGNKFVKRGDKQKRVHTVSDIYTVTNSKGETVKHICIAEHDFCGQLMTSEVPFATVVLGRIND